MKISHGSLEEARRNPRLLAAPPATGPRHISRFRCLQFAAYKVHSEGLAQAVHHLEQLHARHFKSQTTLSGLEQRLRAYEAAFRGLGTLVVKANTRIELELAPGSALTGEVARIDLDPSTGGSIVWLFADGP